MSLIYLYSLPLLKVYTVGGLFGKATDDFSDTGKLVEKTTFGKKLSDVLLINTTKPRPPHKQHVNCEAFTQLSGTAVKGTSHLLSSRYFYTCATLTSQSACKYNPNTHKAGRSPAHSGCSWLGWDPDLSVRLT